MKQLLYINQTGRSTAKEATESRWFATTPFPSEPGKIEIKGEHHEISQNNSKSNYGQRPAPQNIVQPTSIANRRYQGNYRGNTRGNHGHRRGGRPY